MLVGPRQRKGERERERTGAPLMATENAVSIIVGGWVRVAVSIHDTQPPERIIRVVHWSCVRLHNPSIFNRRFWLGRGLDYYE